ncbi:hypothetical protein AB0B50_01680 [Streptomyces sp. NPDC041068]|uniref:hypothetical protein n=1 Tax=Streptomyces sp. NPDC041068 TaxID=3155130 RepID=UPI0033EC7A8B
MATRVKEQPTDNTRLLAAAFLVNPVVILGIGAVRYAKGGDITHKFELEPEGPGEEFVFELGRDHKNTLLTLRMKAEPNCVLDLSVTSAHVDDWHG